MLAAQEGLFALVGSSEQELTSLVVVESVSVIEENVLGARLPVLENVSFRTKDARPNQQADDR